VNLDIILNIFGWISFTLTVISYTFLIFKNKVAFISFFIANILLMMSAIYRKDYGQLSMFIVANIFNTINYFKWKSDDKKIKGDINGK